MSDIAQYDRRTYYRYFSSKDDILYSYCATLLNEMAGDMRKIPLTPQSGFLLYFEFWIRDRMTLTPEQLTSHALAISSEMQKMV